MTTPASLSFRQRFIKQLYDIHPFSLKADLAQNPPAVKSNFISCLVCTARHDSYIEKLLEDLSAQTLSKDTFEVIVLNNSSDGHIIKTLEIFDKQLNLTVLSHPGREGHIGALRNELLETAQGEYVLYLDDDSRLLQKDFLAKAMDILKTQEPDVMMPQGKAIAPKNNPDYQFLDPYSFATRCCFYKRSLLEEVRGFRSDIVAYSDIELSMRLCMQKTLSIIKTDTIEYYHPALYFDSLQKPLAIGQTILKLRKHYPWYLWLIIYLNALRFLPLLLYPTASNMQWFKISAGVLLAPFMTQKISYRT